MKSKIEFILIAMSLATLAAPVAAHARNCELPHEQLQYKCGGDRPNFYDFEVASNEASLSAVQKPRPTSVIVKDYRERAARFGAIVDKANADYRDYVESKRR